MAYHMAGDEDAAFAVSLDDYHGEAGSIIRVRLRQPLRIRQVGVLIIDERGGFIETGMARKAKQKNCWLYITIRSVSARRVTVIVDGIRGDEYLAETRAVKVLDETYAR
ncbi:MAG: hypothetical protein Q4F00_05235 [bacterium]|nr:hypothetical protein [bacterium]